MTIWKKLLDIRMINIETCEPLPNVLFDIWQANATGHYAGHPDFAPSSVGEKPHGFTPIPRIMPSETFLRGAWPTDKNGVAQFTS